MPDTLPPFFSRLAQMEQEQKEKPGTLLTPEQRSKVYEFLAKTQQFLDDLATKCQKNNRNVFEEGVYYQNMWKKQKESGAYPTIADPAVKEKDRQEFAKQYSLLTKFKQENISWLEDHEGPISFNSFDQLEKHLQYHAYTGSTPREEYIASYIAQRTKE